ncbi:MAG: hypothetical protein LBB45_08830 [Methanobrevibacter sp.]|jgi:hypothetical protein|nr:hypothetical protein [Candidatus Methanovirga basalitermitum]
MRNKIIVIAILVFVIAISGCINSDMDSINQSIPKLNDNIKNGDLNFNLAVDGLNSNKIANANAKIELAIGNFKNAKINIEDIKRTYKNLNNTKYVTYIDLISKELEFKTNATLSLQSAIQVYSGEKTTFNRYVDNANDYMKNGVAIQMERYKLVLNNPDLFNQ